MSGLINFMGLQEEMDFIEPTKRLLVMLERILYLNERILNHIDLLGAAPLQVKVSPEEDIGTRVTPSTYGKDE